MAKTAKSKQKKMNARVDFTPMVDMIMLLVTFFMLCTTLIKPQTMEIAMPSDQETSAENRTQVAADKAVTIMIDGDDAIYFFTGMASQDNFQKTAYGKEGIRAELMKKNAVVQKKVEELKNQYKLQQSSDPETFKKNKEEFNKKLAELRSSDDAPSVIIKPSDKATYKNLIDVLDEMQICNIGKYVIDKFNPADQAMIDALNGGAPAQP